MWNQTQASPVAALFVPRGDSCDIEFVAQHARERQPLGGDLGIMVPTRTTHLWVRPSWPSFH